MDGHILEAAVPQRSNLQIANTGWVPGQLFSKNTQSEVLRGQLGLAPVPGYGVNEVVGLVVLQPVLVFDLGTEVVGVRAYSVNAVVGGGNDDGDHLSLTLAQ